MNQSNLRDLVNLSNSTLLNNANSSSNRTANKNSIGKTYFGNTTANKFYIGKNNNEVLYSDIMLKREHSPNKPQKVINNINNVNFVNSQKKPFYNNNLMNKK